MPFHERFIALVLLATLGGCSTFAPVEPGAAPT
jgi:hypothetical protein